MAINKYPAFIGVDLGWYGKPSGLAVFQWVGRGLKLCDVTRLEEAEEIHAWIVKWAGIGTAVVAVDAPTIIRSRVFTLAVTLQIFRGRLRVTSWVSAAG